MLRVCPWFIDFIRLVNVHIAKHYHEKTIARGCPMMHTKTQKNGEHESVLFMEDFASFVSETMQNYWQI